MLNVAELDVYYGYVHVIRNISLEVLRGSVTTVLGPNGSGKTTMLHAIVGLIPIRNGRILFDKFDITNWSTEKILAMGITLVPERREIFTNLSVSDNLWIGAYQRSKKESKASIRKDIDSVFGLFPRLKQLCDQPGKTMSGGEQQMLAIGRALMSKPKMLLMDEPSLGLAPLVVREIYRTISEMQREGTSLLLIEQNYKEGLSVADRCCVLQTGRIAWEGTGKNIDQETIKRLYLGGERKSQ
jgi:branched-chain amino acid transport system ATP-binding protein